MGPLLPHLFLLLQCSDSGRWPSGGATWPSVAVSHSVSPGIVGECSAQILLFIMVFARYCRGNLRVFLTTNVFRPLFLESRCLSRTEPHTSLYSSPVTALVSSNGSLPLLLAKITELLYPGKRTKNKQNSKNLKMKGRKKRQETLFDFPTPSSHSVTSLPLFKFSPHSSPVHHVLSLILPLVLCWFLVSWCL